MDRWRKEKLVRFNMNVNSVMVVEVEVVVVVYVIRKHDYME